MKCPLDSAELAPQNYEAGIKVDRCGTCKGMWLDHQELEKIQEAQQIDYGDEAKRLPDLVGQAYAMALANSKPEVTCPKCQQLMERLEHGGYSQIMIDVCTNCKGVWLDRGEIRALEIFFEKAKHDTKELRGSFFSQVRDLFR